MKTIQLTYRDRTNLLTAFFSLNSWLMLVFVLTEYLLCHYIQSELILTDELYIHTWSEQLTLERIHKMLEYQDQWKFLSYFIIVVFVMWKLFLTTICLNIGTFLMEYKVGFNKLWRIVMNATVVLALGRLFYIGYFAAIEIQTIDDVLKADLFSLLGVFGYDQVPQWSVFALGSINMLELVYWILLSLGMMLLLNVKWNKAFGFVVMTYGIGWWIWLLAGTFLMINLYG